MADVRKVEPGDVAMLASMMARSFQDDPGFSWAVPDPERRRRLLPRYFAIQMGRIYLPKGEVYTTGDGAAAALWAPPGKWETPFHTALPCSR